MSTFEVTEPPTQKSRFTLSLQEEASVLEDYLSQVMSSAASIVTMAEDWYREDTALYNPSNRGSDLTGSSHEQKESEEETGEPSESSPVRHLNVRMVLDPENDMTYVSNPDFTSALQSRMRTILKKDKHLLLTTKARKLVLQHKFALNGIHQSSATSQSRLEPVLPILQRWKSSIDTRFAEAFTLSYNLQASARQVKEIIEDQEKSKEKDSLITAVNACLQEHDSARDRLSMVYAEAHFRYSILERLASPS